MWGGVLKRMLRKQGGLYLSFPKMNATLYKKQQSGKVGQPAPLPPSVTAVVGPTPSYISLIPSKAGSPLRRFWAVGPTCICYLLVGARDGPKQFGGLFSAHQCSCNFVLSLLFNVHIHAYLLFWILCFF